jgi:hypothetical protein
VPLHLRAVELEARGIEHFGLHDLQIMRDLKLPKFETCAQLAWPPHRPVDWSSVAPVARHPGADWAAAQKEDNVRRAANEARWAEDEAARQAESRRAYEASLRR